MSKYQELLKMIEQPTDDCIVWPYAKDNNGYGQVWVDGKSATVHRAALASTEAAPTPKHHAAHGPCHNPSCFNPRHLSWLTRAENEADKLRDGTDNRGEKNGQASLTETDVRLMRFLKNHTNMSLRELADQFGVSRHNVGRIVTYKTWAHI